jgi:hypothetical protein
MLGEVQGRMGAAQDPLLVVEAILAVADDPAPPLRRPVGAPERVALLERRRELPDEAFLALIRPRESRSLEP